MAIDDIIRTATAAEKKHRYASIADLRSAVLSLMNENTGSAASSHTSSLPVSAKWLWLGVALSLIAVLSKTGYHLWNRFVKPSGINSTVVVSENHTLEEVEKLSPPLEPTFNAADGQVMTFIQGKDGEPAYYIDKSPVTYHSYVEFLNAMGDHIRIENGLVKYKDEIWAYMGDGSAAHEQIAFQNDRFVLRDATWASRPVVRITFLGAQAYADHYQKQIPTVEQWQTGP